MRTLDAKGQSELAELDKVINEGPLTMVVGAALHGATIGALVEAFTSSTGRHRMLKYSAIGAGIGLAFYGFTKWVTVAGHQLYPSPAPLTPVVTKGAFAGAPRPLYHTADAFQTRGW
jgi:hypothetical protein